MASDSGEAFGILLAIVGLCLFVAAVTVAICAFLSAGAFIGAGHSIVNYCRAFIANVRPERIGGT